MNRDARRLSAGYLRVSMSVGVSKEYKIVQRIYSVSGEARMMSIRFVSLYGKARIIRGIKGEGGRSVWRCKWELKNAPFLKAVFWLN